MKSPTRFIWYLLILAALLDGALYTFSLLRPQAYETVVAEATPSTVEIITSDPAGLTGSIGTGVVISDNGHILTCDHLFDHSHPLRPVTVVFSDGVTVGGHVLYCDRARDLALVKIYARAPAIKIAGYVRRGEQVVAIGTPYGLFGIITTGIFSGPDTMHGTEPDTKHNVILTSADTNPGNSGGPLLNLNGELVGINEFMLTDDGGHNIGLGGSVGLDEIHAFLEEFKGL